MANVYAIVTNAGMDMIRRSMGGQPTGGQAVAGEEITFTGMGIGDGEMPLDPESLTELVSKRIERPLFSFERDSTDNTNYVTVGTVFDNSAVPQGLDQFIMREIGVYATTATYTTPTLFAYVNQDDLSEIVLGSSDNKVMENTVSLQIIMDSTENVTATISSLEWASKGELQAHINAENAHTADQVGLGNVPNVAPEDATVTYTAASSASALTPGESIKTAFAKIAGAINQFISHISSSSENAAHGSIRSNGAITDNTDTAVGNGDKIVITDSDASNAVKRSSITFGTNDNTFLRKDGSWGTPAGTYSLPTASGGTNAVKGGIKVGNTLTISNEVLNTVAGHGNTVNPYNAQSPNVVLAGPSSGSASVAPGFRKLVAADIPSLTKAKISDFPTSMAPTAHTHGVDDITGTLGIAKGGTGLTASPSMLTNLASTTAANVMAASPRPGVTGTLPVANGGTGLATMSYKNAVLIGNSTTVTSAMQAIRTASGAFYATGQDGKPVFNTLPVAQGGTGVTALDGAVGVYNLRKQAAFASSTNPTVTGEIAWQYQ